MKRYKLSPTNNQKSFNGKAYIEIDDNGCETLFSYHTPILKRKNGKLIKLWKGWTATTAKHIKAFCGLNKKEWLEL